MRTYLIDSDKSEVVIDLVKTIKHSSDMIEFHFRAIDKNKIIDEETIFVRKLAGSFFGSSDRKRWSKLARQKLPKKFLNIDRVFDVYRGYKPSGLAGGNAGELRTQMPGKVIKININVGDTVVSGQTLLILEAMKMENEIKTSVAGNVKAVLVEEGQALESGVLMIEIEEKG